MPDVQECSSAQGSIPSSRVDDSEPSNGAWIVQQPPWTMGKDLGYGLWKVLEYERTDAEYNRELHVRGFGLQAR